MKKIEFNRIKNLFLWFCVLTSTNLMAQHFPKCASYDNLQQHKQDPIHGLNIKQAENQAKIWLQNHPEFLKSRKTGTAVIRIPTVVHVVYVTATENISDAQIFSQMEVLNADYRRLNSDTTNTPSVFSSIAADVEIEFCLASKDPQGNPTNGIMRYSSAGGQLFGYFGPSDDVKSASTGGADPWPTDQYLNLWVCRLFPGLLGYAQFPGDAAATDGVVINYTAFGTMGTAQAPADGGRTATHEVGHWLGLYHIWGDDSDCTGSDSVPDTPNQMSESQNDCQPTKNTCSNEDAFWNGQDPKDMVENYMDYSNDACMNLFTLGQKARMMSFLFGDARRNALFNSQGCSNITTIEKSANLNFEIYPNPSSGIFELKTNHNFGNIKVFDITGREVYSQNIESQSTKIDLTKQVSGVYTIEVQQNNQINIQKIVIQ